MLLTRAEFEGLFLPHDSPIFLAGLLLRYCNFCLPHTSVRQPLLQPEPTHGTGSATQWRPCTPAMAAGLTDHVWTLREVLLFRVPPWPQQQEL